MPADAVPNALAVTKALELLDAQPELMRAIEEIHLHLLGEELSGNPREQVPGIVLRWLHCYADLELWHEALLGRSAPADIERALDLAAQLEELGIEAADERGCLDCEVRTRCR